MAGALLRSGSVKEFKPLGATGNPVYRAASQLRAAIRRHIGGEMADYFAIPQQDDKGDTIDWYAPQEGGVVPWTAATPEERGEAKARLLAAQRELRDKSRVLQSADTSEQQVFGRLLELATRIPGEDHVYLVDGRPVMTFWGFAERDAPDYQDVLAMLDIGNGASAAVEGTAGVGDGAGPAATATTRTGHSRRWSWPWILVPLLLALLLLTGLLFGLRGCVPAWLPGAGLIAPPEIREPEKVPPDLTSRHGSDTSSPSDEPIDPVDREARQTDGATVVDAFGRRELIERSTTRSGVVRHADEEAGGTGAVDDRERSITEDTETGAAPGAEEPEASPQPGEEHPAAGPDESPGNQQQGTEQPSEAGGKDDTATARDQPPDQAGQRPPTNAGATAQDSGAGAPLVIPKDAARNGSTDFMNGNWQSVTGLQDANGNPVKLEYAFKNGQGTAKLHHSAGGKEQECTAGVRSSFKGSTLMIDQTDDIRCPDGTRFQRSAVECATNAQGRAECKGRNQDGSAYQVRINKQ